LPPDNKRADGQWRILLAVPFVALLLPIYVRAEPSVAGIPFFYCYQIAFVPISAALTWIVYLKTRENEG
jgi:Protein of unknown function (DUF3311)